MTEYPRIAWANFSKGQHYGVFCREYQDCIRAAKSTKENAPMTRAEQNKGVIKVLRAGRNLRRQLFAGTRSNQLVYSDWSAPADEIERYTHIENLLKLAVDRLSNKKLKPAAIKLYRAYLDLHVMTKSYLCLIMSLKQEGGDVLTSMMNAADHIDTGENKKLQPPYFWVEVRLVAAFVNAGGEIKDHEKSDVLQLLRRFREDCGSQTALYHGSVGRTRVHDLLEYVYPRVTNR